MGIGYSRGVATVGVRGAIVEIEVDSGRGLPATQIVGAGDAALMQARERVRAAILNSGMEFPPGKVVVSLSPAALRKTGSGFDLAIAAAILCSRRALPSGAFNTVAMLGELALDGRVRPVRGVLPAVLAARDAGMTEVVVPVDNLAEARLVDGIQTTGVSRLSDLVDVALGCPLPEPVISEAPHSCAQAPDLAEVRGQIEARRALEVAASGGHNMLLLGPPGSGKTMLATRLPGLLPDLDHAAALETTAIHSLCGTLDSGPSPLLVRPPLEAPHHTASLTALVGGGNGLARPGACSRAHNGVLFLDEAAEFNARTLDTLRTPVEEGRVRIARRDGVTEFPARFQLVLAANECPCGAPEPRQCSCPADKRRRYLSRISGPLRDRIDITVQTRPVGAVLLDDGNAEDSATVRDRVLAARDRASTRWRRCLPDAGIGTNAHIPGAVLRPEVPRETADVLAKALRHGLVTARGADRCMRLGFTVADLAGRDRPRPEDVNEALILRGEDY